MGQVVTVGDKEFTFPDDMSPEDVKAEMDKYFGAGIPTPKQATMEFMVGKPRTGPRMPYQMPSTAEGLAGLGMSIGQGATFNTADEMVSAAKAAAGRGSYSQNMAKYKESLDLVPRSVQTTGGALGAVPLAAAMPFSFLRGASPTAGSLIGRGSAEGAMYGALYGAGAAEPENRLSGGVEGGIIGGVMGAGTGAVSRLFLGRGPRPNLETLQKEGAKLHKQVESSPIRVKSKAVGHLTTEMRQIAHDFGTHKALHPRIEGVFSAFDDAVKSGGPIPMKEMMVLRRIIRNSAASTDPTERALASRITDVFDDFIERLPLNVAGKWRSGRLLWSRFRKAGQIEAMIDNAGIRAGQFTGSGYENALRTEFSALARNPKRMRLFTKEEQRAIRLVAEGGTIGNFFRALGRFAPRGVVSTAGTALLGHGVGGPAGVAGGFAIGEAGRRAATSARLGKIDDLLYRITTGSAPLILSAPQINALRSILAAEQASINIRTPEVLN